MIESEYDNEEEEINEQERWLGVRSEEMDPDYMHKLIKHILKPTYGIIMYQEQVIELGHTMGNMSRNEADNFRKIINEIKENILA